MPEKANVFDFYCEKIEADVDRNQCNECEEFPDCKKEGYLGKIDQAFSLHFLPELERKRKQSLARMIRRARKEGYLKDSKKKAYTWKITGVADAPKPPFREPLCAECNQCKTIFKAFDVPKSADLLNRLSGIAESYLGSKTIWNDKHEYSETTPKLRKIKSRARKLSSSLDELDPRVYSLLQSELETEFITVLSRLEYEAEEIIENVLFKKTDLANFPLFIAFNELARLYEDVTGKPATTSYNPSANRKGVITDKSSQFINFVYAWLQCVDPKAIWKR